MKLLSSKRWAFPVFILLVSLSCKFLSGDSGAPAPSALTPTEVSPTPQSVTITADVVFGPGSFFFPDPTAGLSELDSYKATLTISFDGTNNGQPRHWSKSYVTITTRDPAVRQWTLEKSGDLSDLDSIWMAEAEGASYERHAQEACVAHAIEEAALGSNLMEPAQLLNGVIGAEEAGTETVSDMVTNHYTFDERAFGQSGLASSSGEMWVATEGGYLIRYLVTTTGNAEYFGEGVEGSLTWDYELTDVNKPLSTNLPEDCPAGLINAPLLADASNIMNVPSVLRFQTSTTLADVAAFYQTQLPDLGWQPDSKPNLTGTSAILNFTQESKTMTVVISTENGVTTVHILLAAVQK